MKSCRVRVISSKLLVISLVIFIMLGSGPRILKLGVRGPDPFIVKPVFAQTITGVSLIPPTNTTVNFTTLETILETGETNKYYNVGGVTLQRNTKGGAEKLYYLFPDHLSSTRVIVDKDMSHETYVSYYPYGNLKTSGDTLTNITNLYTSQKKDSETNLYYYNARYYNPTTGHFLSADKAQGPNRYSYVSNNPLMKNDPSGNREIEDEFPIQLPMILKKPQDNKRKPLRQTYANFGYGDLFLDRLSYLENLLFLGIPNSRGGSIGYLDESSFENPEFSEYLKTISYDLSFVDLSTASDELLVDLINSSINRYTTFNKEIISLINQNNKPSSVDVASVIGWEKVYFGIGDIGKLVVAGKATCGQLAAIENYFLGQYGIQSEVISATYRHHVYVRVNLNGKNYIADPTIGVVFPENYYLAKYGIKQYSSLGSLYDKPRDRRDQTYLKLRDGP